MSNLVQATAKAAVKKTIADYMRQYEPEFQRALGKSLDAAKFGQDALTAIKQNPAIEHADPRSLFGALFLAAQLRLPVGGPLAQFHLTTRTVTDKRTGQKQTVVVPIVGYGGYIQLMMNTGLYSRVSAFLVYENDHFKEGANSERGEFYDFEKAQGDRGKIRGVVAYAKMKGFDDTQYIYRTYDEIISRNRPKYWEKTPWESDEKEMLLKTGIRVLQKWVPKTAEDVQLALLAQSDQAVVKKIDGVSDLEVQHDDPEVVEATVDGE